MVSLEPVIQVMYEMELHIETGKQAAKPAQKEFMPVTPNGEVKPLSLR